MTAAGNALIPGLYEGLSESQNSGENNIAYGTRALAWFDHYLDNLVALVYAAMEDNETNVAIDGIIHIASYVELRGFFPMLERITLVGLDVIDKVRKKGTLNPLVAPQVEALLLTKLGLCAQHKRRYDEAIRLCNAAEEICGDGCMLAHIRNIRGNVLLDQHHYEDALREFESAAEYFRTHSNPHGLRMIEHNIGNALARKGDVARALPYLQRDLDWCQAHRDELGEAHTLNTLGLALLRMEKIDEAKATLFDAVRLYRQLGDAVHVGQAINDLGLAFAQRSDWKEAYQCHLVDFEICVELADNHGAGRALLRMADNLVKLDNKYASNALRFAIPGIQLIDPSDRTVGAEAAIVVGEIAYSLGFDETARAMMNSAATNYQDTGLPEEELSVHVRHGYCLLRNGLPDTAVVVLESAVSDIAEAGQNRHLEVEARQALAAAFTIAGRDAEANVQAEMINRLLKTSAHSDIRAKSTE